MIQSRVIEHGHDRVNRPCLCIICTVNHPLYPCVNQSPCTHGAGLNCNKQLTLTQAVVADCSPRLTQSVYFGVSSGIAIRDIAIKPATYDFSAVNHNGTDGDFAGFKRTLGAAQRLAHPDFIIVLRGVRGHSQYFTGVIVWASCDDQNSPNTRRSG